MYRQLAINLFQKVVAFLSGQHGTIGVKRHAPIRSFRQAAQPIVSPTYALERAKHGFKTADLSQQTSVLHDEMEMVFAGGRVRKGALSDVEYASRRVKSDLRVLVFETVEHMQEI